MSHSFRRFVFATTIIYAIGVASIKGDFTSTFLRFYDGDTLSEYVDYSLKNVSRSTFRINKNKPTVIYIHGYTEHVEKESVRTVVQAYLKRKDHNIIAVDYGTLVNGTYLDAIENARRISHVLVDVLNEMAMSGLDMEKLHIVGHSLGSQVAGFIGKNSLLNFKIPRITGLDPAGPLFNFLYPCLSSRDARFVDIIHTDRGFYYGIFDITGTVDFFPNGGKRIQPGCPEYSMPLSKDDFCSHHRSWRYYAESLIDESAFVGVQCSSSSNFASDDCHNNTRVIMGYATPSTAQGKVYLKTSDKSPFGLKEQGLI